MKPRSPISNLPTHDVTNMPPHMGDQNLWADDIALREWIDCQGGGAHTAHLAHVGSVAGTDETFEAIRKLSFSVQAGPTRGLRGKTPT